MMCTNVPGAFARQEYRVTLYLPLAYIDVQSIVPGERFRNSDAECVIRSGLIGGTQWQGPLAAPSPSDALLTAVSRRDQSRFVNRIPRAHRARVAQPVVEIINERCSG